MPVLAGFRRTREPYAIKAISADVLFEIVKDLSFGLNVPFILQSRLQNAVYKSEKLSFANAVAGYRVRKQTQQVPGAALSFRFLVGRTRPLVLADQ